MSLRYFLPADPEWVHRKNPDEVPKYMPGVGEARRAPLCVGLATPRPAASHAQLAS